MLCIQHKAFPCDSCMEDILDCHTWFSLAETVLRCCFLCHCLLVPHPCPCKHNLCCYELCVQS